MSWLESEIKHRIKITGIIKFIPQAAGKYSGSFSRIWGKLILQSFRSWNARAREGHVWWHFGEVRMGKVLDGNGRDTHVRAAGKGPKCHNLGDFREFWSGLV